MKVRKEAKVETYLSMRAERLKRYKAQKERIKRKIMGRLDGLLVVQSLHKRSLSPRRGAFISDVEHTQFSKSAPTSEQHESS